MSWLTFVLLALVLIFADSEKGCSAWQYQWYSF